MKKNHLVIILVILAALVALYVVQNSSKRGTATLREKFVKLVPNLVAGDVYRIKAWPGDRKNACLDIVRDDEKWKVASRWGALAGEKMDSLLLDIKNITGEVRSTKKEMFPDFELTDKLAMHVLLMDADGETLAHVLAGKKSEDEGAFVRIDGSDTTYETRGDDLRATFKVRGALPKELDAKHWIELSALKLDSKKIKKIRITGAYKDMTFELREENAVKKEENKTNEKEEEREKKKKWALVTPALDFKLKEGDLKKWLSAFNNVKAVDVADPRKAPEYGFQAPLYEAQIEMEDNSSFTVSIGNAADGPENYYMTVSERDEIFTVRKGDVTKMFSRTGDVLDMKVYEIAEDKVDRITLSDPDKDFTFVLKGKEEEKNKWELHGHGSAFKLKSGVIDRLLANVKSFTPFDVVQDPDNAAWAKPVRVVKVSTKDGNVHEITAGAQIPGREINDERFVKVSGLNGVFSVKGDFFNRVFHGAGHFLEISPVSFKPEDARRLVISNSKGSLVFEKKSNKWRVKIMGIDFFGRDAEINRLIRSVSSWKPNDFTAKKTPAECGLDAPAGTLALTFEGGNETVFKIGSKTEKDSGEYYCAVSGSTLTYIMPGTPARFLEKDVNEWVEYRIVGAMFPEIKSMEVKNGEKKWKILQNTGEMGRQYWSLTDEKPDKGTGMKLRSFIRHMKNLKAVDVINPDEAAKYVELVPEKGEKVITVITDAGGQTVTIGGPHPEKKGHVLARMGGSEALLVLPATSVESVFNALKTVPTVDRVKKESEKPKKDKGADVEKKATPDKPVEKKKPDKVPEGPLGGVKKPAPKKPVAPKPEPVKPQALPEKRAMDTGGKN